MSTVAVNRPSPLLTLPGAVAAEGLDAGIAWHYGDPLGEQRAASSGAALLDRSHRGLVTVAGPDRLAWLHTLTTQHLRHASDGTATEALWLSPQGHIEHYAGVTDLDGITYLDTEPGCAQPLLAFLESMRFWSKVEPADSSIALAGLTVAGLDAPWIVRQVLGIDALAPGRAASLRDAGFLRATRAGVDVFLARSALGGLARDLIAAGARPAGSWAAEALRIPTRTPRFGVDNDARTIPNELPWLATAVHLNKGCYRGQETVARVDNLGRPPRRLVLLNLDGSANSLPATGDAVTTADGRVVGRVGTVAQHWEDGPIALALVKRTAQPEIPLLAGGIDALVDPADASTDDGRPPSAVDRTAFTDIRRR